HTIISMNSVMVDGTGMCGGCRVIVGGETKYACVDGPEFDGHLVNWDIAMNRSRFYTEHEGKCKLRSK
ncbi:MAG: NAD-binding oxidoreductase, partial [Clostridia bacterium]